MKKCSGDCSGCNMVDFRCSASNEWLMEPYCKMNNRSLGMGNSLMHPELYQNNGLVVHPKPSLIETITGIFSRLVSSIRDKHIS